MNDRTSRDTALLRADAEALASGTVFWQGAEDVADTGIFVAAGDGPPPSTRSRDVQHQWVQFWGNSHMRAIEGPRGSGSAPIVRFRERLRPGQIEPAKLMLDQPFRPRRRQLAVGADPARLGFAFAPSRSGQVPN
jgi:hypothetical protein